MQTVLVPSPIHVYVEEGGAQAASLHLTPQKSVFFVNFNCTLIVYVHGFYNVVCFSPNTAFHQLV